MNKRKNMKDERDLKNNVGVNEISEEKSESVSGGYCHRNQETGKIKVLDSNWQDMGPDFDSWDEAMKWSRDHGISNWNFQIPEDQLRKKRGQWNDQDYWEIWGNSNI